MSNKRVFKLKGRMLFFMAFLCTFALISCKNKPQPSKTSWQLVWGDEFDYTGFPDSSKWNYEHGYIRNQELQYYTIKRKENAWVEDGKLNIVARLDSALIDGKKRPITSACLDTKGKAEWTYGRVVVRAKLPKGRGTWPAIWMLGANIDSVGWPMCGEIDIMEHVGYDPGVVHATLHTATYNWVNKNEITADTLLSDYSQKFHNYAVEWTPDSIVFSIDNKPYLTYKNPHQSVREWPFSAPSYLILNLAIGGGWGGKKGVDLSALPARYQIDYVRVYKKEKP